MWQLANNVLKTCRNLILRYLHSRFIPHIYFNGGRVFIPIITRQSLQWLKKQPVFTSTMYMYLTKCIINTWSMTLSLSLSLSDLIVQFDSFVVVSPGLHLYSFLGDVLCSYSSTEDSQQHIILLNRLVQSVTKIWCFTAILKTLHINVDCLYMNNISVTIIMIGDFPSRLFIVTLWYTCVWIYGISLSRTRYFTSTP